ncbi:hypothetical protein BDD12DRAFT_893127 [Trichophaea hybrida]|nr:hypothetical protein BDD12DRAFT_893127 [Trichophaea hybrida]
MLGQLRMSTDDPLDEYTQLVGLEEVIKRIVEKYGGDGDTGTYLIDVTTVLARVAAKNIGSPTLFCVFRDSQAATRRTEHLEPGPGQPLAR